MTAQLELDVDPARRCKPKPVHTVGDGYNAACVRCWMNPCGCYPGCFECGAMPGEPGCQYCWHADANGFRTVARSVAL